MDTLFSDVGKGEADLSELIYLLFRGTRVLPLTSVELISNDMLKVKESLIILAKALAGDGIKFVEVIKAEHATPNEFGRAFGWGGHSPLFVVIRYRYMA